MNNLLKNGELKQGALKRFSLQWVFCQKSIPRRVGLLGVLAFCMIKAAVQSKTNKFPYLRKHHSIFRRGVFAPSALVLGSVFGHNLVQTILRLVWIFAFENGSNPEAAPNG